MFQWSNKEAISKFNKTEYGKKINKILYVFLAIFLIFFVVSCIICCFVVNKNEVLKDVDRFLLNILVGFNIIAVIIVCYFDGKRDGAIEQFKMDNKK